MRDDISAGYQIVQSCHSVADFAIKFPEIFNKWQEQSNSIISLSVKNKIELEKFKEKLIKKGINFVSFYEPDIQSETALCIEPTELSRKITNNLPLAGKRFISKEEKLLHDMSKTYQTPTQTVLQHGESVWEYFQKVLNCLQNNCEMENILIPETIKKFAVQLTTNIHDLNTIEKYCKFHDCGKPYCLIVDENGKNHFPDHANVSYKKFLEVFPDEQITANLILQDMDIHLLKDANISEFMKKDKVNICTLILVGLSEILSNCQLFGGINSDSFKIKFKTLEQRCKKILPLLFTDNI